MDYPPDWEENLSPEYPEDPTPIEDSTLPPEPEGLIYDQWEENLPVGDAIQEEIFPESDQKDFTGILDKHKRLIEAEFTNVVYPEKEPTEITNLTITSFAGIKHKQSGTSLFGNGIDMSLWNVDGKSVLVSTVDNIVFVGAIRNRTGNRSVLDFELLVADDDGYRKCAIEIGHKADQSMDKLLVDWALLNNQKETEKAWKKYFSFMYMRVDNVSREKEWMKNSKLRDPLLYLTFRAMEERLRKRYPFDKNYLINWLLINTAVKEEKEINV